jgi:hypothetical protein
MSRLDTFLSDVLLCNLRRVSNLISPCAYSPPSCETLFSPSNLPEAFIVLIPVEHDPKDFSTQTRGVCSECSNNDNRWKVDNGSTARPGDKLH